MPESTAAAHRSHAGALAAALALGLAAVPAGARRPAASVAPYELGMIYQLPANPDLARAAAGIEHQLLAERDAALNECAVVRDNAADCERRAEITFRRGLTSIPGVTFRLQYADPAQTSAQVDLFALSGDEAVNQGLDLYFVHIEPQTWVPFGVHFQIPACTAVRDSDSADAGVVVNADFMTAVCDLMQRHGSADDRVVELAGADGDSRNLGELSFLVAHGADVNYASSQLALESPLTAAAQAGNTSTVAWLVDHQADVNRSAGVVAGAQGTPLIFACRSGHTEVAAYLLDHGADVAATDMLEQTALWYAADGGHLDLVQALLAHGADANAGPGEFGATPLMRAAAGGYSDVVKALLDQGAHINDVGDVDGYTALMYAARYGHADTVALLLDRGAKVGIIAAGGESLIAVAAEGGSVACVNLLLARGVPLLHMADHDGENPLMVAASAGQAAVAEVMLVDGEPPNEGDNNSWTALMYAAAADHPDVAAVLLRHGALLNLKNADGKTALDIAREKNNPDMVDLLVKAGTPHLEP